ncbi:hypothetical protein CLOSYM_03947 [[Clostridium] symbiosum ATCC 14940]|uniref:Uncharacterized protein n=1 Tax=[Clostridium] symbiosum ATCC 14940 TaxID=411472 RepID=A0ABC9TT11_CLOSY|nr:hypothetical protein CLOSYM_03947 [[Clostridium] symbiosum ATCC 14940]
MFYSSSFFFKLSSSETILKAQPYTLTVSLLISCKRNLKKC